MADTTQGIRMDAKVTINVPPAQAYEFWRALENFPRFMKHISEVKATQDNRYMWKVDAPLGMSVSWEADVTDVVKNERIAWKTRDGAQVPNEGVVTFTPSGQHGTELHVKLSYEPPAGQVGHAIATLFGKNPQQQMETDLQRCKQILEEGITADGVTRSEVEAEPTRRPH